MFVPSTDELTRGKSRRAFTTASIKIGVKVIGEIIQEGSLKGRKNLGKTLTQEVMISNLSSIAYWIESIVETESNMKINIAEITIKAKEKGLTIRDLMKKGHHNIIEIVSIKGHNEEAGQGI